MLLHIASKDCFKGNDRSDTEIKGFERKRSGSCYLKRRKGETESIGSTLAVCMGKTTCTELEREAAAS